MTLEEIKGKAKAELHNEDTRLSGISRMILDGANELELLVETLEHEQSKRN